jgi:hypothetical protein
MGMNVSDSIIPGPSDAKVCWVFWVRLFKDDPAGVFKQTQNIIIRMPILIALKWEPSE